MLFDGFWAFLLFGFLDVVVAVSRSTFVDVLLVISRDETGKLHQLISLLLITFIFFPQRERKWKNFPGQRFPCPKFKGRRLVDQSF